LFAVEAVTATHDMRIPAVGASFLVTSEGLALVAAPALLRLRSCIVARLAAAAPSLIENGQCVPAGIIFFGSSARCADDLSD